MAKNSNGIIILRKQRKANRTFLIFLGILGFVAVVVPFFGSNFLNFINGTGPLWFTTTLLIFALFYVLWRQNPKESSERGTVKNPPSNIQLVLIVVLMSVVTYLIRFPFPMDGGDAFLGIQFCFVVQYIIMLILGVIAYKRDWFRNIPDSLGKLWLFVALVSIIFMLLIGLAAGALEGDTSKLAGGFHWQAFAYATWESVYSMGMSIGLITLFRKKWNNHKFQITFSD